jgi:hypothetical protein
MLYVCILVSLSKGRLFASSRRLLRVRAAAALKLREGVKWGGLVIQTKKSATLPTKVTYTTCLLTQLTILIHALFSLSRHTGAAHVRNADAV